MKSSNPNGRPPLDRNDKSHFVTVGLPGRVFDALDAEARRTGTNVPTVIRQRVMRDPDATDDE